jgi:hypothetical protein
MECNDEVCEACKVTIEDLGLKDDVIAQWVEDLSDPDFGVVFNADYPIALTKRGKVTGDAALYLAIRNADVDPSDIFRWYETLKKERRKFHSSDYIVNMFTGIPLDTANKLMYPRELLDDPQFDMLRIKPKYFLEVLDVYLKTGVVDWKLFYHLESIDVEKAKVRRDKKQKALSE